MWDSHLLLITCKELQAPWGRMAAPLAECLFPNSLLTSLNRADAMKRILFLLLRGLRTGSIHMEGKRTFSLSIHPCHCHGYTSSNEKFLHFWNTIVLQTAAPAWFCRQFSKHFRQKLLLSPHPQIFICISHTGWSKSLIIIHNFSHSLYHNMTEF